MLKNIFVLWNATKCSSFWTTPEGKIHEANMEPTWVLSAPDGPHVGPMNIVIGDCLYHHRRPWRLLLILTAFNVASDEETAFITSSENNSLS